MPKHLVAIYMIPNHLDETFLNFLLTFNFFLFIMLQMLMH